MRFRITINSPGLPRDDVQELLTGFLASYFPTFEPEGNGHSFIIKFNEQLSEKKKESIEAIVSENQVNLGYTYGIEKNKETPSTNISTVDFITSSSLGDMFKLNDTDPSDSTIQPNGFYICITKQESEDKNLSEDENQQVVNELVEITKKIFSSQKIEISKQEQSFNNASHYYFVSLKNGSLINNNQLIDLGEQLEGSEPLKNKKLVHDVLTISAYEQRREQAVAKKVPESSTKKKRHQTSLIYERRY